MSLKGIKVLVVDDEPDLRDIISSELADKGAQVYCASSGQEGIAVYERELPLIVLSDVRMPGSDGIELLKHIRGLRSEGYFAFMTAFADLSEAHALELGAHALFNKPFKFESVFAFMERCARNEIARSPRIHARVKCFLRVSTKSAESAGVQEVSTHTLNLSDGGMFVQIPAYPMPNVQEEVEFRILKQGGLEREIAGRGICRWKREEGSVETPRGFGMQFKNLSAEDVRDIQTLVKKITG